MTTDDRTEVTTTDAAETVKRPGVKLKHEAGSFKLSAPAFCTKFVAAERFGLTSGTAGYRRRLRYYCLRRLNFHHLNLLERH